MKLRIIYAVFTFEKMIEHTKITRSARTIHALVEVENKMLITSANMKETTENTADKITTARKLLTSRIAESTGKIIRAEIRSEPTRRIPSTTVTAVITAILARYKAGRPPDA